MPTAEDISAQEARALAGMYVHRRLAVPSAAFRHDGRRFLVAEWEQKGIGVHDMDALAKIVPVEMVREAWEDIEQMAVLMDTVPVWEGVCEEVNRLHRIESAKADADRCVDEWRRGGTTAAAVAVAAAVNRLVEAEAPEIHAPTGAELFDRLMAEAASTQGRKFLGIAFPSLPLLNARMDGLRGLTFLAGSPGTGKTSLALHIAFDAAEANTDTVVVFLTCEMSTLEVQASLVTRLTGIPFQELMKGKPQCQRDPSTGMMLPKGDITALEKARARIAALGHRWQVVHPSDVGGAFVGSKRGGAGVFAPVTALANRAKQATGASRVLVVVDSLQRVPVAEPTSGSVTGWMGEAIERDNYVVAALNDLASGVGDAVLCISEQNKAQQGTADITSMRGTAGIGYTCDSSLMLTDPEEYGKGEGEEQKRDHIEQGFRWIAAHLVKGRHGSRRGMERLRFDFHTHAFTEGGR